MNELFFFYFVNEIEYWIAPRRNNYIYLFIFTFIWGSIKMVQFFFRFINIIIIIIILSLYRCLLNTSWCWLDNWIFECTGGWSTNWICEIYLIIILIDIVYTRVCVCRNCLSHIVAIGVYTSLLIQWHCWFLSWKIFLEKKKKTWNCSL